MTAFKVCELGECLMHEVTWAASIIWQWPEKSKGKQQCHQSFVTININVICKTFT